MWQSLHREGSSRRTAYAAERLHYYFFLTRGTPPLSETCLTQTLVSTAHLSAEFRATPGRSAAVRARQDSKLGFEFPFERRWYYTIRKP